MKNSFVQQFSPNIKFKYSCFDRVVLRGYIRWLSFPGGVVKFLRLMGLSYIPFQCEFYFNGHNAIHIQLDKQGVYSRRHDNAFADVDDPEAIRKAVESLHCRAVLNRVTYWMNLFFKFDKGKYSTCSKYLQHEWYLSQVEISSNIVFRSARFCTSLFERILDKFQRRLPESITQIFSRPHPRLPIQDLLETLRQ
ncbi:MAG: hypothetical protein M0P74_18050 [Syntrophales bacterium]|nr:hypothetical protein [Syntrophales bacterium]